MRSLIAANWKMHGNPDWVQKPSDFNRLFPAERRKNLEILICPPFTILADMVRAAQGTSIKLGAQTCHSKPSGAHTGEISAEMAAQVGAEYVIVGHSERRAEGVSNEMVAKKARAAQQASLTPIICVGEPLEIRKKGTASNYVIDQIVASVPKDMDDYVIAYEPIWAIGTGKVPTLEDIEEMHKEIRRLIGPKFRILYGGSVKPTNSAAILGVNDVNGALIGGAGLEMESLTAIAKSVM